MATAAQLSLNTATVREQWNLRQCVDGCLRHGIGGIAPDRKSDLTRLGLRAVLGGTLATMMTATIAGVLTTIANG